MLRRVFPVAIVSIVILVFTGMSPANEKLHASSKAAHHSVDVAKEVDQKILAELQKVNVSAADTCSDEDFLRRTNLDIIGQLPAPQDVVSFRADSDPHKRTKLIDKLLESPEFGVNWARYWRDVIYIRSTEQRSRLNQVQFENWIADKWNQGTGWNETVSAMLTATGDVEEHPETALIFAQGADANEIAAEACRIFLGIQLQCANCHDHPSDIWKRQQFHELAAYFPRISERRSMDQKKPGFEIVSVNTAPRQGDAIKENPERFIARFDRNRDHRLTKEEMEAGPVRMGRKAAMNPEMKDNKPGAKAAERLFDNADANKDGFLTADEIKTMPPPPNNMHRGSTEHRMVDLQNPAAEGTVIDPKFFVDGATLPHGASDEERRKAVAHEFTSPKNPWFARAFVNRIWAEMLGEGFYMPVDDLGPKRTARYPDSLELLCHGFVASGYDPKWLVRTIANTETYQRKIQSKPASETELPFASANPVPLRSDVVFSSLIHVFGTTEAQMMARNPKKEGMPANPQAFRASPRFGFDALFGIDPSTPKDEITGTIPQSLMLMNSRRFRAGMSARGETRLGTILRENGDNRDALKAVYLLVLAREPSSSEVDICLEYIKDANGRPEAFEDIMWSLLNSSEFISRR